MSLQQQSQPLNAGISALDPTSVPPVRNKRRLNRPPKLTVSDLTATNAVSSIVAIGRSPANQFAETRNANGRGHTHANSLAAIVRRVAHWAAAIAPKHSLPQFVIAVRELASNRLLRSQVANMRLAQLRGADLIAADGAGDGDNDGSGVARVADDSQLPDVDADASNNPVPVGANTQRAMVAHVLRIGPLGHLFSNISF